MFLAHVIGGKHLSARADFTAMVRGATPDVVLTGVELLARGLDAERPGVGDVVVVDVGGATTDVHSVVELDPEDAALSREVVADHAGHPHGRGRPRHALVARSSTVEAAELADLADGRAARGTTTPAFLPDDDGEADADEAIAAAAIGLALRRHAGRSQVVVEPRGPGRRAHRQGPAGGRPAGRLGRRAAQRAARRRGAGAGRQHRRRLEGGWQLPRAPRVVVDHDYVLAAAGLLAAPHPDAAYRLVLRLVTDR